MVIVYYINMCRGTTRYSFFRTAFNRCIMYGHYRIVVGPMVWHNPSPLSRAHLPYPVIDLFMKKKFARFYYNYNLHKWTNCTRKHGTRERTRYPGGTGIAAGTALTETSTETPCKAAAEEQSAAWVRHRLLAEVSASD